MEPDPLVVGILLTAIVLSVIMGIWGIDQFVAYLDRKDAERWQKFAAKERQRLANRKYY